MTVMISRMMNDDRDDFNVNNHRDRRIGNESEGEGKINNKYGKKTDVERCSALRLSKIMPNPQDK